MTEVMNEVVAVDDSTAPIIPNQTEQFDLVDIEGAAAYMNNYQEAIKALLTPADYQTIANKDFKKKSAWRKLATAFRISDEIVNEQLEYDDVNQIVRARYRVRCTLPNGRSAEGVGVCSIYDKIRYVAGKKPADTETPSNFVLRGRFSNAEHDVPSTAHSRAKNRAISDLIGAGEVSAEEMSSNHETKSNKSVKPQPVKPIGNSSNLGHKPKTPKPTAPKKSAQTKKDIPEAIEVEHTVIDKPSVSLKEAIDQNKHIRNVVDELQGQGATVNRDSIKLKLLDFNEMGKISVEDYKKAKELLE